VLLAAPSETYDEIATAIDARLGARVKPLFAGVSSPEAVIAMGAVLESRQPEPLDLYPHPPAVSARVARALRGPNAVVATSAAAAVVAALWAGSQLSSLHADRAEADRLRTSMRASAPAVEPMRAVAERRADFARQVEYVRGVYGERSALTRSLVDIAAKTPTTVRFDSLRVSRVAAGWSVVIAGSATGATGAQSVRALDTFMQALRGRDGVSNANLDQLDYEAAHDSTHMVTNGPVIIQFRTSFVLARPALESR
jgi:Tfp pilus assembly protein PilN